MSITNTDPRAIRVPAGFPKTDVQNIKAGQYMVDEFGYVWHVIEDFAVTKSRGLDGIKAVVTRTRPVAGAKTQLIDNKGGPYVLPPPADRQANIFTEEQLLKLV